MWPELKGRPDTEGNGSKKERATRPTYTPHLYTQTNNKGEVRMFVK